MADQWQYWVCSMLLLLYQENIILGKILPVFSPLDFPFLSWGGSCCSCPFYRGGDTKITKETS